MAYKYFLYSLIQLNFRKQTELKLGRKFEPRQFIVNGRNFLSLSYLVLINPDIRMLW